MNNTCSSLLIISQKVKQLNCHVKSVNLPLAFSRSFVKGKEWIDKVNPPSRKPSQVTRWSRPLPVETNNSSRLAATLKITVTNINETALQNLSVKISNKNFWKHFCLVRVPDYHLGEWGFKLQTGPILRILMKITEENVLPQNVRPLSTPCSLH